MPERRVLLTSNASYDPPRGGSTRSNLVWLRSLASTGDRVRVVSAAWAEEAETVKDGVAIRGIKDLPSHSGLLAQEIDRFSPNFVLVSSEDVSHRLLREVARSAPGRLVYLAHTPQFFPFGPESWNPDQAAAETVRRAHATVVIGQHMAAYVEQHLGHRPLVIHPPIYQQGASLRARSFDSGEVLMINPCAVKGISILLEVARCFPSLPFAALAGWGTTGDDRRRLAALPNIRIVETAPKIDDVLDRARILLMPSLWYEGFGLIAMEAMLRGLPVIASNSGGLKEAKQGTGFVVPVAPVVRYLPEFDEVHMPKPVIPAQDLAPWIAALQILTTDSAAYAEESARSRQRATNFVSQLDAADFARLLDRLSIEAPAKAPLSTAQKAQLIAKLRQRPGR